MSNTLGRSFDHALETAAAVLSPDVVEDHSSHMDQPARHAEHERLLIAPPDALLTKHRPVNYSVLTVSGLLSDT
eukprot:400556-Pleurochrysis_carterae.AAC.1